MVGVRAIQTQPRKRQITEHESLQSTRNLLRLAIFSISYIRGFFPENYFCNVTVANEMKAKKLLPVDLESRRLIDWMEQGVYDALTKKYLRTMLFSLCEGEDGPTIEEYSFSFAYSYEDVVLQVEKEGGHRKILRASAREANHDEIRKNGFKMIRTLVTSMSTLKQLPSERTILMKLYYFDDVTPEDYEPPFFRCCTYDKRNPWRQVPFKMKAGELNSSYFTLALKVKSSLDPREVDEDDENVAGAASSDTSSESDQSSLNAIQLQNNRTLSRESESSPNSEFAVDAHKRGFEFHHLHRKPSMVEESIYQSGRRLESETIVDVSFFQN